VPTRGGKGHSLGQVGLWKTICIALVLCAAAVVASPATTFTTLVSFDGTNGEFPEYAPLVQGLHGNLYGTTAYGGANGEGTVFKITPGGTLTTLHSFDSTDGEYPYAGLVQATSGNFHGTTSGGGANGYGTVFKITPGGTLTTLHSFDSADGAYPYAGLVQATNGNFYGTTSGGGANGYGTVFKITPEGTLTTLYSFCAQPNCTDGATPYATLVQATNGNFYGTTEIGGANGYGTVFKITARGTLTTLYSFCAQPNCSDGATPYAGLVQATNGNFYGTTFNGGADGYGTVFKITPRGMLTRLRSFDGTDGASPIAGLVQATDGNFYGTTEIGKPNGEGTVFEITARGTLTTLHSFAGADGAFPFAGLAQGTNGNFYGTAYEGGTANDGTVFSLSVGLGPFVETLPTSGKVGTKIIILGNNLTGASSVTFNGTAATFTVVENSEITTTVPTGATTGTVEVTTPKGTLKSNVPFRVTP